LELNEELAKKMVEEIAAIHIDDGMIFEIKSVAPIMDETDYPGIRLTLDTTLENMRTPLKIDFSTGDVITPREVAYSFRLLFEERTISILAYNLETVYLPPPKHRTSITTLSKRHLSIPAKNVAR